MTIPSWTLIGLTAIFFIREAYIQSKQKPNDYDIGYHNAVKDICNEWNATNKQTDQWDEHCHIMKKFLQDKLDEW